MASCFILRANVTEYCSDIALTLRGINGVAEQVSLVQTLLERGKFQLVKHLVECESNESAFDSLNMSSDVYMTVGDVILWDNGKREVALDMGWSQV